MVGRMAEVELGRWTTDRSGGMKLGGRGFKVWHRMIVVEVLVLVHVVHVAFRRFASRWRTR